jgi:hypothetical protein
MGRQAKAEGPAGLLFLSRLYYNRPNAAIIARISPVFSYWPMNMIGQKSGMP